MVAFPSSTLTFPFSSSTSITLSHPSGPRRTYNIFKLFTPRRSITQLTCFNLFTLRRQNRRSTNVTAFSTSNYRRCGRVKLISRIFSSRVLGSLPKRVSIKRAHCSAANSDRIYGTRPTIVPAQLNSLTLTRGNGLIGTSSLQMRLLRHGRSLIAAASSRVVTFTLTRTIGSKLS